MTPSPWTPHHLDRLCNEVLSVIELTEARLLNWGFLDGKLNLRSDLHALLDGLSPEGTHLWEYAQQHGITIDDILRNLQERKLIFGKDQFSSRFASAVRLFFLLRQRFRPFPGATSDSWQTASRLVSDMRLSLQRRRYPQRTIPADSILSTLESEGASLFYRQCIEQLLQTSDGSFLTLAHFQRDAVFHQFRSLQARGDRACVIGAGTGSGKTKAFYLPALAEIAQRKSSRPVVQALALYPRTELLKDQFMEAFQEARKLDSIVTQHGKPPIRIGAYYGDTPVTAGRVRFLWTETSSKDGFICPFMRCPNERCDQGEMIWSTDDINDEIAQNGKRIYGTFERLRCAQCGIEIPSHMVMLTRKHMLESPPDLLFTTTEMLNRRLSRASEHALFGLGKAQPPPLLLLDEIHTYEGLTGAHVAYLLRRWRTGRGHRRSHPLYIVGLSATLTDASSFFATLTGLSPTQVSYITPRDEDMIDEGMEYNLVLKGDPVSSTSLLSTSVQTAMLLGRVLDSRRSSSTPISRGALGTKTFAFTDKLDVINRWYHIEEDAETQQTLANLRRLDRSLPPSEIQARHAHGQIWRICEEIGHDLRSPLRLELTSSQYRGVDKDAELVIATSALEVGYNDPEVGAVLQHKAPRSLASFLQRKGRAGRPRTMRPWTIVVASAYGRDRWAFQHAEHLFAPTLPPIDLPLDNAYIRKIQATYVLMDWLSLKLTEYGLGDGVWEILTNPGHAPTSYESTYTSARQRISQILKDILIGTCRNDFETYLREALHISQDRIIELILWGQPRPLLTEVLPTLIRQLDTNWYNRTTTHAWAESVSSHPLPTFVPPTLFTDLNLPELMILLPPLESMSRRAESGMRQEMMALGQGMTEFAPGHVTKRFAHRSQLNEAHWIPLPDEAQLSRGMLPLQYLPIERSTLPVYLDIDSITYALYRPYAYTVETIPKHIKSTSSARLRWRSHFAQPSFGDTSHPPAHIPPVRGQALSLPPGSIWNTCITSAEAFLHAQGTWMNVSRLAIGVDVDTRVDHRSTTMKNRRRTLFFEEQSEPAALGFTTAVDALCFHLQPLHGHTLLQNPHWATLYQSLGSAYVQHQLNHDRRLHEAGLSSFEIEWLWHLESSMLIATAIGRAVSLEEAFQDMQRQRDRFAARALHVIFQSIAHDDDEHDTYGRLHTRMLDVIQLPLVEATLNDLTPELWNPTQETLIPWLEDVYRSSLGATLFTALTRLVPENDPDELILDIEHDRIWISEATAGGVGLLEKLIQVIHQTPHLFDFQLEDTLQHCDTQALARQLRQVADLLHTQDPELCADVATIRSTQDIPTLTATQHHLATHLEAHGIQPTRDVIVALNAKFLRANSDQDTDALIGILVHAWNQAEITLGVRIDLRVFAVAAMRLDTIKTHLQRVLDRMGGTATPIDEQHAFNLLQSLLWMDCHDSCPNCIHQTHLYQDTALPSRAVLLAYLAQHQPVPVRYGTVDWQQQVQSQLAESFRVDIQCGHHERDSCHRDLLDLLTTPIDLDIQLLYPTIAQIRRHTTNWIITLIITE